MTVVPGGLSVAVTVYNRGMDLLSGAVKAAIDHPAVSEIAVVDDHSEEHQYEAIRLGLADLNNGAVNLYRNEVNLGMSKNKAKAVSVCGNDWVLLFDSDNELRSETIDAICGMPDFQPDTIYAPCFAEPNFDFRSYEGQTFDIKDVAALIHEREMSVMLNTCNYVVNRVAYGRVYQHNPGIAESDTIWFNYLWLRSGGKIHVVPGMKYLHRVHDGSGWKSNANKNIQDANRIKAMIVAAADGNV